MRNKRDAASISKLDLDSFVFTPPGSMGWQSHETETGSDDDASEERFSMAGRLKEFPSAAPPPHSGKNKSSKNRETKLQLRPAKRRRERLLLKTNPEIKEQLSFTFRVRALCLHGFPVSSKGKDNQVSGEA